MTNEEHQLDEMVNAIQQVTAVSETKGIILAKQQVINIIENGIDSDKNWHEIIIDVMAWCNE
jgi:hypothetical protein